MRGVLVLTMALVLTTSLAACGKQGPLRLPMTGSAQTDLSNWMAE